jgi:hypothetical protein
MEIKRGPSSGSLCDVTTSIYTEVYKLVLVGDKVGEQESEKLTVCDKEQRVAFTIQCICELLYEKAN